MTPRTIATKDVLDRVLASVLMLLLLPVLVLLAAAVKLTSPGPVLYRQRRVGRDDHRFDLLKFRSMRTVDSDDHFRLLPGAAPGGVEGADRRTAVGKLMRRTSFDELPQLLNVARGHMSLVGPRPERPEFVAQFTDQIPGYADRHRVQVGMTGLAQIRGLRGQTSIAMRADADNEYIARWSLALDAKILLLTARAVARPPRDAVGAASRCEAP